MDVDIVILAAGKGTRMRSELPKVLQPLAATPLLRHVLNTATQLAPKKLAIIYGHGGERVPEYFADLPQIQWIKQQEQLGTGHAVEQALPALTDSHIALILYGDVPLTHLDTLTNLLQSFVEQDVAIALLTANLDDPTGYGRIVRDEAGRVQAIVEQKDATEAQQQINEVNTGILAVRVDYLKVWITQLDNNNAQGEYYLTDVVALAVKSGQSVATSQAEHNWEIAGVNDKLQLAELERQYQFNQAKALMREGVTIIDPKRIDIRGSVDADQDVLLDINVIMMGQVTLGAGTVVGANTVLKNVTIGKNVTIKPNCVLEEAVIGDHSVIGPFARIRPGSELAEHVHIGNFVEIKKTSVSKNTKINHLSYVGDAVIGQGVNIGAGTITCNYDGANKHQTVIEDDVFIGSDTQLIAPVRVGARATIGAGTTVSRDAPADELTVGRSKQHVVSGWSRPVKK